jgi:hypothetical protein
MAFRTDPFRSSILASSALTRALAVLILLAALWAAIAWAVALP